jgi:hypothetical protein
MVELEAQGFTSHHVPYPSAEDRLARVASGLSAAAHDSEQA